LAGLAAASVHGVLAVGGVSGRRPQRLGRGDWAASVSRPTVSGPETPHARWEGFDLHAGVAVRATGSALSAFCRYVLRPPVTGDRLSLDTDGQVLLQLRHPWADGTTHLRFAPAAFLERLAVLVPRRRVNLLLYYRVLARARAPRS